MVIVNEYSKDMYSLIMENSCFPDTDMELITENKLKDFYIDLKNGSLTIVKKLIEITKWIFKVISHYSSELIKRIKSVMEGLFRFVKTCKYTASTVNNMDDFNRKADNAGMPNDVVSPEEYQKMNDDESLTKVEQIEKIAEIIKVRLHEKYGDRYNEVLKMLKTNDSLVKLYVELDSVRGLRHVKLENSYELVVANFLKFDNVLLPGDYADELNDALKTFEESVSWMGRALGAISIKKEISPFEYKGNKGIQSASSEVTAKLIRVDGHNISFDSLSDMGKELFKYENIFKSINQTCTNLKRNIPFIYEKANLLSKVATKEYNVHMTNAKGYSLYEEHETRESREKQLESQLLYTNTIVADVINGLVNLKNNINIVDSFVFDNLNEFVSRRKNLEDYLECEKIRIKAEYTVKLEMAKNDSTVDLSALELALRGL